MIKLVGKHWWADSSKSKVDKIIRAHFKSKEKEIIIDYEYQGHEGWLKLHSSDGIHFMGDYKGIKEIGTCEFTLYKNKEGYLLFGGGFSPEDGNFNWFIELKPQGKNRDG